MATVRLSKGALEAMHDIAVLYRREEFPSPGTWIFSATPGGEVVYRELRANGLVKMHGNNMSPSWSMTALGQAFILQHDLGIERNEASTRAEDEMVTEPPSKKKVFVVHGREMKAFFEIARFLDVLKLEAVDFNQIGQGFTWVGDIVKKGISEAWGVIVVFTPDEATFLSPELTHEADRPDEKARYQARPNVLFEAGIAFGLARDRTVVVTFGEDVKLPSDIAGGHVVRLNNSSGAREMLWSKLKAIGCDLDTGTGAWTNPKRAGDFDVCISQREPIAMLKIVSRADETQRKPARRLRQDPETIRMEFRSWLSTLSSEETRMTHYYDELDEQLGFVPGSTKIHVQSKMPRSGEGWIVTDLSEDAFKVELKSTLRGGGGLRDFSGF